MSRIMQVVLQLTEQQVGTVVADLLEKGIDAQVAGIGLVEQVPFTKNKKPDAPRKKKKMPPWSAKRKRAFRAAQKKRKKKTAAQARALLNSAGI